MVGGFESLSLASFPYGLPACLPACLACLKPGSLPCFGQGLGMFGVLGFGFRFLLVSLLPCLWMHAPTATKILIMLSLVFVIPRQAACFGFHGLGLCNVVYRGLNKLPLLFLRVPNIIIVIVIAQYTSQTSSQNPRLVLISCPTESLKFSSPKRQDRRVGKIVTVISNFKMT